MRFCHRRSLGWVTSLGLWGCGWWLAAGLLVNGEGARAIAADHIRVGLSILELSLPVEALEEFAATGQVTRSLRPFVRGLDQQDLAYLRLTLTTPLVTNPVEMSQLSYGYLGEEFLQSLGRLVQTEARQNGFLALRAAMIRAAHDPEGIMPTI